jgi:hypothetical protein
MGKGVEKGTQLRDDWWPSSDLIQWAAQERPDISPEQLKTITEDFVDYWTSESGARTFKRSWERTYKRWIRNHIVKKRTPYNKDNTPKGFVC